MKGDYPGLDRSWRPILSWLRQAGVLIFIAIAFADVAYGNAGRTREPVVITTATAASAAIPRDQIIACSQECRSKENNLLTFSFVVVLAIGVASAMVIIAVTIWASMTLRRLRYMASASPHRFAEDVIRLSGQVGDNRQMKVSEVGRAAVSEPSAEAFAAVFQAAGWHYTPDLMTMTPAESRAWKAAAGALDAAVARERERCAKIADTLIIPKHIADAIRDGSDLMTATNNRSLL